MVSEVFEDYPANQIEALMWAVIAQMAAAGQRRPPNRGMVNDIYAVSRLLPYCDGMLVDNECRALLQNIPDRYALGFATRLWSPNNSGELSDYLRELESQ